MSTTVILLATLAFNVPGFQFAAIENGSVFFIAGGIAEGYGGYELYQPRYGDIELYHPSIEDLKCSLTPPPLKSNRVDHTSFYYDDSIYLCGGLSTGSTCISYSSEMSDWKTHTISSSRMEGQSSVVLRNTLYLIGGKNSINPNTVEVSRFYNADSVSTPLPLTEKPVLTTVPNLSYKGMSQCATEVDQDNLVITGGYYGSSLSNVTQYNINTNTETALPSLQQARFGHACIVVQRDNKKWVIVAGGNWSPSTAEMIGWGESSWTYLGDLNVPRVGPTMVETERGVMVIGGHSGQNSGFLSSVELLDWASKEWSVTHSTIKTARVYFGTAVKIPASMFNCVLEVDGDLGDGKIFNPYTVTLVDYTFADASDECCSKCESLKPDARFFVFSKNGFYCACFTTIDGITPVSMDPTPILKDWITEPVAGVCGEVSEPAVSVEEKSESDALEGEAIFILHMPNKTEVLDLENPSCSRLTADTPDQRLHPSIHLLNNEVVICGGAKAITGTWPKPYVDSCIVSSTPARGNWSHHSTLITRNISDYTTVRWQHSGEVFGDEIYLVDGVGYSVSQLSDKFTNGEWVPGPDFPLYFGGGSCSTKTGPETMVVTVDNKTMELNVTSGEWRRLPDMPQRRYLHGCTTYENYVIVTGSMSGYDSKSTYRLDLNTEKWERIGDMEVGKVAPELVTVNNRVVALGGLYRNSRYERIFLDTVEELDTETFTWKKLDVKLKIGDAHTRAVVMDRKILCK